MKRFLKIWKSKSEIRLRRKFGKIALQGVHRQTQQWDWGSSIARYRCSAMVREEQVSIKLRSRKIAAQSAHGCKRLSHKGFNSPVWVGPTDIRYVYSDAETSRLNRRTKEKRLDLTLICYKQSSYIILLERAFTSRMPNLHKNGVDVPKVNAATP